jgi:phage tail-like protein
VASFGLTASASLGASADLSLGANLDVGIAAAKDAPLSTEFLVRAFRFTVDLTQWPGGGNALATLTGAGFQECSGLDIEMDVQDILVGGRNDAVVRRVGRAKYQPLLLKRGMFFPKPGAQANNDLWGWLQKIASRETVPVPRYDGVVSVLETGTTDVVARWRFERGLPLKVVGPQLNARTGEVAIEELHIAHEGLVLESS